MLFGRIDEEGGDRWYIGRRHVETEAGDEVVIEWRTPIAEPFYRAGPGDPLGLVRRRQLMVEHHRLVSFADDVFDDARSSPASSACAAATRCSPSWSGPAPARCSTSSPPSRLEQDEVIRAPLPGVLAVQGGPGSGKTAIGLHRAAFLLFNHRDLARAEVLIVGPSRTYLGYIAQVLPSLGEEAVVQVTLADLVPQVRVHAVEPDDVARLKGDPRLSVVIARASSSDAEASTVTSSCASTTGG